MLNRPSLLFLSAFALVGHPLKAQQRDVTPYLIEDRAAEIALARSAGPAEASDSATVLVLTPTGYTVAVKGSNGFTCVVLRSFAAGFEDPQFWNPKLRAPNCFNPPASRTVVLEVIQRAKWLFAGMSQAEAKQKTREAFATHKLPAPAPGAMAYMISQQQYLQDDEPHNWVPHLMFFYDRSQPSSNWGAGGFSAPIIDASAGDPQAPYHTFLIPVRRWSDGTLATQPAGH